MRIKKTLIEQREIAAQKKKQWVRLTRACNNNCIFCLDSKAQNGSFISLEQINEDFKRGREAGIKQVVLSGGEPTIHPQFLEIVEISKKLGYEHIQVITNGRMFAYTEFLHQAVQKGISEITFSIHGDNSQLHDQQTQVSGSFRQSLKGLMNALKVRNLIISLDVVINRLNVKYLYNILKYFIGLGVREFDLLQVIPYGHAWHNKDILLYDVEKASVFLNKAFSLSKNPNLHIWTNRFPPKYLEGFEYLIQHPVKLYDEIGGRSDVFNQFLNSNIMMNCNGKKCSYCFLEKFCNDLIELKKNGELFSHNHPFCLKELKTSEEAEKTTRYVLFDKKNDVINFIPFYIKFRYFIKSSRCRLCKYNVKCTGAQCDYVRKHGFKVLSPFLARKDEADRIIFKGDSIYKLLRLDLNCNADCLFCNVPPESYKLKKMSTNQAKLKIDHLISADERLRLDITGGEPTLRRDLEELIRYAVKKKVKNIQIQTNGILLVSKEYVKRLKKSGLNQAFVALHSSTPKIHDYLVGKDGAFEKCVAGIKNLLGFGIEVALNPVITTMNYETLPDYITFIKSNFSQIKSISLSVVQPRGRVTNNSHLLPRYRMIDAYVKKALFLGAKSKLIIRNPYCGLPLCIGGWHKYLERCMEYCENRSRLQLGLESDQLYLNKIKGPDCSICDLNNFCNGVWREYAEIHSFFDLKPIKLKSKQKLIW